MLPHPGVMFFDHDLSSESEFTFFNLDLILLALGILTAGSACLGHLCSDQHMLWLDHNDRAEDEENVVMFSYGTKL